MTTQERISFCPDCGKQMALARVTGRAYGRFRLLTYECKSCNQAYTEAVPEGDDAPDLPPSG